MKYPLEPKKDWHHDKNYKKTGAELVHMSPEEFLSQVRPMVFDKRDKSEIKRHLKKFDKGKEFEPLSMRADGTEDGRHRALSSMIKGIKEVPVLKWEDRENPPEAGGKGVMATLKKVVRKYREKEKHK